MAGLDSQITILVLDGGRLADGTDVLSLTSWRVADRLNMITIMLETGLSSLHLVVKFAISVILGIFNLW